jgi:dTDP-4-dehydrorhamnose 3,5-epimerase
MKVLQQPFQGVKILDPEFHKDERGFFLECFQKEIYAEIGITEEFVQDNHSRSAKNVLRGLHFSLKKPQSQIVTLIRGKIFDVLVDVRKESSTFGKWFGTELSDEGPRQIYMPHGFAHGFCVLSDWADLHYKVSQKYDPNDEGGLNWSDPEIKIQWPVREVLMSSRDKAHPFLTQFRVQGRTDKK